MSYIELLLGALSNRVTTTVLPEPCSVPGIHVCNHSQVLHDMQALPPEGVTAATQAVITRNAELVEAMAALRCFLRDEHSNLVQVLKLSVACGMAGTDSQTECGHGTATLCRWHDKSSNTHVFSARLLPPPQHTLMHVRPSQAIWYICRRVLTPVQEAHLSTVAVSLNASPDMLSFAEARPVVSCEP